MLIGTLRLINHGVRAIMRCRNLNEKRGEKSGAYTKTQKHQSARQVEKSRHEFLFYSRELHRLSCGSWNDNVLFKTIHRAGTKIPRGR